MFNLKTQLQAVIDDKKVEIYDYLTDNLRDNLYYAVECLEQRFEVVSEHDRIYPMYKLDEVMESKGYTTFNECVDMFEESKKRYHFDRIDEYFYFEIDGYLRSTSTCDDKYDFLLRGLPEDNIFIEDIINNADLFKKCSALPIGLYLNARFIKDLRKIIEQLGDVENY